MTNLESYFEKYRAKVIGAEQAFETPFGIKKIVYADWTASGRMYGPIEDALINKITPFVGNTHTETTVTGCSMTMAYHKAKTIIKSHVNANENDALIAANSGMTGVVNKLQRILGLRVHEKHANKVILSGNEKPIVFVTHMEHHSNQTSWIETLADVVIIKACPEGLVCMDHYAELLEKYKDRSLKIAAITSCSNVTGIKTPYHEMAKMIHKYDGYCFVDFACSAPYIDIDMHPDEDSSLDAIYFSPHKFLGGPSSAGILIFNKKLYTNRIPDNPGGGTVDWTNPWGEHKYYDSIEAREDGGTPAFLQTIRVGLCIKLKESMGVDKIMEREHELIDLIWDKFKAIDGLHVLAPQHKDRLSIISFYIENLHYNLGVKILNDRFGIQVRGGCSCAGTYGHYLLNVGKEQSNAITCKISEGELTEKPGWIRMSMHPITTNEEAEFLYESVKALAENFEEWANDYTYDPATNEFHFNDSPVDEMAMVEDWFNVPLY